MALSSFFYNYFPLYSKFRTVTMILFLVQLCLPLLGILGLSQVFKGQIDRDQLLKGVKYTFYITGGFCLLFAIIPGALLDFTKGGRMSQMLAQSAPNLLDAIQSDRKGLLQEDAWRSFIFIALTAGALFLTAKNWVQAKWAILGIGVLLLVDLWGVNKRYVNDDSFKEQADKQPIQASRADQQILNDQSPQYRVLNLQNPFNDAVTSYHHRSVGGYHGAKMGRYQELIDYNLQDQVRQAQQLLRQKGNMQRSRQGPVRRSFSKEATSKIPTLNMLNTKYLKAPARNNKELAIYNPSHYGPAWYVQNLKGIPDADQLILQLDDIDPRKTALYNTTDFPDYLTGFQPQYEPNAKLKLTKYEPNEIVYQTQTQQPQFAVFSEIYYNNEKGWKAYIDGEKAKHIRVNYVLRGMKIPAGKHKIHFKFEPSSLYQYEGIALASSLLILIGFLGSVGYTVYQREPEQSQQKGQKGKSKA